MLKPSAIEWTDYSGGDANFVWRGSDSNDCKISPGCANCYVDRIIRLRGTRRWPQETTFFSKKLKRLLNTKIVLSVRRPGRRPMVFVCDTGDLFHKNVTDEQIFSALNGFIERADVVWQVLTKRTNRMEYLVNEFCDRHNLDQLPDNIWIGVSAENQGFFDARVEALKRTRAVIRWVSIEPILGPIDLNKARWLSWVVAGGENGKDSRPAYPSWIRRIRDACVWFDIPFFFKHWGQYIEDENGLMIRVSRALAGRVLDNRTWDQFPDVE